MAWVPACRLGWLGDLRVGRTSTAGVAALTGAGALLWDAVDAMNSLAPAPVVTTATGGRGGGGGTAHGGGAAAHRRSLHTSARNRFIGRAVAFTARPVDAEVQIALSGGQRILAGITNESVDCLRLRPGRNVWVLVKTVAISILSASAEPEPGVNRLCGRVQRITLSDGPAEVVLALDAGVTIRGVIDASHLEPARHHRAGIGLRPLFRRKRHHRRR